MGLHEDQQYRNRRQAWVAAGALALVSIALEIAGSGVREALAYDREALAGGQLWRLATAHVVHLGAAHLLLNLAGLALVTWLVGHTWSGPRWLYIGFVSVVAIDAGFWFLYTELGWYVGLSGVLHGLLAAGLLRGIVARDREAVVLAIFVVAKLAWEQIAGPMPGSAATTGGAVIVDAHLYGALGGLAGAAILQRRVPTRASL